MRNVVFGSCRLFYLQPKDVVNVVNNLHRNVIYY